MFLVDGGTALPFGNIIRERYFQRKSVTTLNTVIEGFESDFSQFIGGNMDSGQHGLNMLCNVDVVNADDRDVFGNSVAVFFEATNGTDGGLVIGT